MESETNRVLPSLNPPSGRKRGPTYTSSTRQKSEFNVLGLESWTIFYPKTGKFYTRFYWWNNSVYQCVSVLVKQSLHFCLIIRVPTGQKGARFNSCGLGYSAFFFSESVRYMLLLVVQTPHEPVHLHQENK